jgi:hypothetical protein
VSFLVEFPYYVGDKRLVQSPSSVQVYDPAAVGEECGPGHFGRVLRSCAFFPFSFFPSRLPVVHCRLLQVTSTRSRISYLARGRQVNATLSFSAAICFARISRDLWNETILSLIVHIIAHSLNIPRVSCCQSSC